MPVYKDGGYLMVRIITPLSVTSNPGIVMQFAYHSTRIVGLVLME